MITNTNEGMLFIFKEIMSLLKNQLKHLSKKTLEASQQTEFFIFRQLFYSICIFLVLPILNFFTHFLRLTAVVIREEKRSTEICALCRFFRSKHELERREMRNYAGKKMAMRE